VDIKTVIPAAIKFLKQVENIQGRVLVHCVSGKLLLSSNSHFRTDKNHFFSH